MTEKEKMIQGLSYNPLDEELTAARMRAQDLCHDLASLRPSRLEARREILRQLLPLAHGDIFITPPFYCDYGWNIRMGKNFYCNTGCVILDCAPVSIGNDVMLGPYAQIYTAHHPVDPEERAALVEYAYPVNIGDKVWIGGSAVICPGVSIGDGSVIGAGSVVTKDIPAGVVAVGNPCKIIKKVAGSSSRS